MKRIISRKTMLELEVLLTRARLTGIIGGVFTTIGVLFQSKFSIFGLIFLALSCYNLFDFKRKIKKA